MGTKAGLVLCVMSRRETVSLLVTYKYGTFKAVDEDYLGCSRSNAMIYWVYNMSYATFDRIRCIKHINASKVKVMGDSK